MSGRPRVIEIPPLRLKCSNTGKSIVIATVN